LARKSSSPFQLFPPCSPAVTQTNLSIFMFGRKSSSYGGGRGSRCRTRTSPQQDRCRANMARLRQSRLKFGLGFQVEVLKTFQVDCTSFPPAGKTESVAVTPTQSHISPRILVYEGTLKQVPPRRKSSRRGSGRGSRHRTRTRLQQERCRANLVRIRQSRLDFGLGFQVEILKHFKLIQFSSPGEKS
jgi:hypothetical protein